MSSFSLPLSSFRQVLEVSDREPSRRNPFIPLHAGVIEGAHLGMPLPTRVVLPQSAGSTCRVAVQSGGGGDGGPPGGGGSMTQVGFDLLPSPAPPAGGPTPSVPVSGISQFPNPGPGPNGPGIVNAGMNCAGGSALEDREDEDDAEAFAATFLASASSCGLNLMGALRSLVEGGFIIGRVVRSRLALACVWGDD